MKWPALANGSGAFINLLKVRQLSEIGRRLARLTVRVEERFWPGSSVCTRKNTQRNQQCAAKHISLQGKNETATAGLQQRFVPVTHHYTQYVERAKAS